MYTSKLIIDSYNVDMQQKADLGIVYVQGSIGG